MREGGGKSLYEQEDMKEIIESGKEVKCGIKF